MAWFLAGCVTLFVLLFAGSAFARADARRAAVVLRNVGGILALLVAALLLLRGLVVLAIPLALAGLALLGLKLGRGGAFPFGDKGRTAGSRSRVQSSHISMELDHDTGAMEGQVVAGRYAGRDLSSLSVDELLDLRKTLNTDDPQGVRLLEAYLDRRDSTWRDRAGADARTDQPPRSGRMTRAEALDILGLKPDATKADIRKAHHTLMKKLHPDQGGSTWFASQLNEAKDVLLG